MNTLKKMAETAEEAHETSAAAEAALRVSNFVMGAVVTKGPDGKALDQPMWYPDVDDAAVKSATETVTLPRGVALMLGAAQAEKPADRPDKPGKSDKS